jgi:hypothetical protein
MYIMSEVALESIEKLGAGSQFAATYTMLPHITMLPHMTTELLTELLRDEANDGRIDNGLLREAYAHLDDCIEDPRTKVFMTLRRWKSTPELKTHYDPAANTDLTIVGEQQVDADDMPEDTSRLFDRLYELTGANVVRDDLRDQNSEGVVIRQGEYKGSPVFFRETYAKMPDDSVYRYSQIDWQRSLGIEVMGESRGKIALVELSLSQQAELVGLVGYAEAKKLSIPPSFVSEPQAPTVNTDNFLELTHAFQVARTIAAELAVGRVSKEYMARNLGIKLLAYFGLADTLYTRALNAED